MWSVSDYRASGMPVLAYFADLTAAHAWCDVAGMSWSDRCLTEVGDVEAKLAEQAAEVERLSAKVEDLEERIEELQSDAIAPDEYDAEIEALEEKLAAAEAELAALRPDNARVGS